MSRVSKCLLSTSLLFISFGFVKMDWVQKKSKQNEFPIKLPYRICLTGIPGHIKFDLC